MGYVSMVFFLLFLAMSEQFASSWRSLETGPACQEWVQELLIVQVSKKYYSLLLFVVLLCLHYPCFYKVQKMEACSII